MHCIEIPSIKLKKYFPADLSECDQKQYIDISQLLFLYQNGDLNLDQLKVQSLYLLLNMKRVKTKHTEEKFANIAQLSDLLESFFESDDTGARIIKTYYIHNPIQRLSNGIRSWSGPSEGFKNVSFGEYVDAINHFGDFVTTGDFQYLRLLMATFYRPTKSFLAIRKKLHSYDGEERIYYNPNAVERIADQLKYFPIGVFYGFFLLFSSFQKYLSTAKIYVEGKEIDLSVLFSSNSTLKESALPSLGMRSILNTMAESQIFGPMQEVRKTNLYEIMLRMYDIRKRDEDYKANNPTT